MTVKHYYLVFGFCVDGEEFMKLQDYNIEQLPAGVLNEYIDEYYGCEVDINVILDKDEKEIVKFWFAKSFFKDNIEERRFEIDGSQFIARTFTHDVEINIPNPVVIGVELGEFNIYDTTVYNLIPDAFKNISVLAQNSKYVDLIGGNKPSLYILRDDCWCCN